jgi:site-specific recombinase XerD
MPGLRLVRRVLKVRWTGEVFVSKFGCVQNLIDYLWLRKSGSKRSVILYCWFLAKLCRWAKLSPEDLLSKSREELEQLLQKFLDEVHSRSRRHGISARHVNTAMACLKTFFRKNDFNRENNLELRLQSYYQAPRTRNRPQYVPTLAEACLMSERAGSKRNRAVIKTLKSTGLRNSALRAMIVKDVIKELEEGYENLLIKVEPEWNKRIPGACKNSIPYYTFTSADATQAIREMLDERKERLDEEKKRSDEKKKKSDSVGEYEPLFISEGSQMNKKSSLSDRELQEIVKNAAKEAGIKDWKHVTPHSLRKVFESILRSPMKNGGRMDPKDQEFLMGHILPGTQDAYYDWTKINKLRSEFSKLVFEDKKSPELESLDVYREMARIFGIDPDEVKTRSQVQLGRLLTLKEEKEALVADIKARLVAFSQGNAAEQKIIPKGELQTYLDNGWKFLGVIDQQQVIVQRLSTNEVAKNFAFSSVIEEVIRKDVARPK